MDQESQIVYPLFLPLESDIDRDYSFSGSFFVEKSAQKTFLFSRKYPYLYIVVGIESKYHRYESLLNNFFTAYGRFLAYCFDARKRNIALHFPPNLFRVLF